MAVVLTHGGVNLQIDGGAPVIPHKLNSTRGENPCYPSSARLRAIPASLAYSDNERPALVEAQLLLSAPGNVFSVVFDQSAARMDEMGTVE